MQAKSVSEVEEVSTLFNELKFTETEFNYAKRCDEKFRGSN